MPALSRTINNLHLTFDKFKSIVNCQMSVVRKSKGFTLIELLIVIALLSILAAFLTVLLNPVKRFAQARDANRKSDIHQIAKALVAYHAEAEKYPDETNCDSSIGLFNTKCADVSKDQIQSNWSETNKSYIYTVLVGEGYLKRLPTDPKNNLTFHYRYEPRSDMSPSPTDEWPCVNGSNIACRYWIGGRLEAPDDPQKPVFRCSDIDYDPDEFPEGPGCKAVSWFRQ